MSFCLPGGLIGVYTGSLPKMYTLLIRLLGVSHSLREGSRRQALCVALYRQQRYSRVAVAVSGKVYGISWPLEC